MNHYIVSHNTDRMLSLIIRLAAQTQALRMTSSIICLQDISSHRQMTSMTSAAFRDKYEVIISRTGSRASATNNSSDHMILCHKQLVKVIKVNRMEDSAYANAKATALGVLVELKRPDNNNNSDNNDRNNNRDTDHEGNPYSTAHIFSTYIRPMATYTEIEMCFKWIQQEAVRNKTQGIGGISRLIILGDFNASNPLWNKVNTNETNNEYNRIKKGRGRQVSQLIRELELTCLNAQYKEATYKDSCIDLALIGKKLVNKVVAFDADTVMSNQQTTISTDNTDKRDTLLKTVKIIENPERHSAIMFKLRTHRREAYNNDMTNSTNKTVTKMKKSLIRDEWFDDYRFECNVILHNWQRHDKDRLRQSLDIVCEKTYRLMALVQWAITIEKQVKQDIPDQYAERAYTNTSTGANDNSERARAQQLNAREIRIRRQIKRIRLTLKKQNDIRRKLVRQQSRQRRQREIQLNRTDRLRHAAICKSITMNQNKIKRLKSIVIYQLRNYQDAMTNSDDLWDRIKAYEKYKGDNVDISSMNMNDINSKACLNKIARTKFPSITRKYGMSATERGIIIDKNNNNAPILGRENKHGRVDISDEEVYQAIHELRNKKYTSPEGIKMEIFHTCISKHITDIITTIAKISFRTCYIPLRCHGTKGTLIPKKAPGKYRIVHISNPLAALLEIIALHRIEYRLEKNGLLSKYQFGFTALRDRHDLIGRVIEIAASNDWSSLQEKLEQQRRGTGRSTKVFNNRKVTTLINLDIEGAFDNVDHDILIDKLLTEFGDDNIKYWTASFILNRTITLQYKTLTTKSRTVQKGVPQGSALGPILFNYIINQVVGDFDFQNDINDNNNNGIIQPAALECLCYADDLLLVHKGHNQVELQEALTQLNNKLATVGLKINPTKCESMTIRTTKTPTLGELPNTYQINGQNIKETKDKMRILGVDITPKLKLHRDSTRKKIDDATNRLFDIKAANIVHTREEWLILIETILLSHININNWTILTADFMSRKTLNRETTRAMKMIFDWPPNTSNRCIRLIMNTPKLKWTLTKMTKNGIRTNAKRMQNTYIALHKALEKSSLIKHNTRDRIAKRFKPIEIEHTIKPLEPVSEMPRRYFNPKLILPRKLQRIDINDQKDMNNKGPMWLMLEQECHSMAVLIQGYNINHIETGYNRTYTISYFNTLSLIWKLVHNEETQHKKIALPYNNAILMALKNNTNRDWRIITLREKMIINKWDIYTIHGWQINAIKSNLQFLHSRINCQRTQTHRDNEDNHDENTQEREQDNTNNILHQIEVDNHNNQDNQNNQDQQSEQEQQDSDIEQSWEDRQERQTERNTQIGESSRDQGRRQRANQPRILRRMEEDWSNRTIYIQAMEQPDLTDYNSKNIASKRMKRELKHKMMNRYMTSTCRDLTEENIKPWQKLSPSRINGTKLLMLSGVYINNRTGRLEKHNSNNTQNRLCDICNMDLVDTEQNTKRHPTLHRGTECETGYKEQQRKIKDIIDKYDRPTLNKIAGKNMKDFERIIKQLSHCALHKSNDTNNQNNNTDNVDNIQQEQQE